MPSPNYLSDTLFSVAAASGSDAWAVGYSVGSNGGPIGIALKWNGAWTQQPISQPSVFNEVIADVVYSAPDYWAVGSDTGNSAGPGADQPFVLKSSGPTSWLTSGQNGFPAPAVSGTSHNEFFAVGVPAVGDVWAVGAYRTPFNLAKPLVENYSGLAAPTGVSAAPGDRSATVTWALPCSDGGSAITSYVVTAHDACTVQGAVTVAGATTAAANFTSLTNGNSYTFTVAPVNGFGVGPESAASLPLKPAGPSVPTWVTACSAAQYMLTGSDGATWQPMDSTNLAVSFTPSTDSWALLSGNADLWTSNPGFNQDIGVGLIGGGAYPSVPGQPEAWKESGGSNGTYSPNTAYVQIVVPVLASKTYTANLQWKASRADPYLIAAGAGPIGAGFSPTRLTVQLFPKSANTVFTTTSWGQYRMDFNGGAATSWLDVDPTNLKLLFTPPPGNWTAYISANADLWTSTGGYNQDIGVHITGGNYPPIQWGLPDVWKESGGNAGTFSPNAAFVQAPFAVTGGTTYTTWLQWKTNQQDPHPIFAGAGPIGRRYSPTTLSVILVPVDPAVVSTGQSFSQYSQPNSDGAYWQIVFDGATPTLFITPSADSDYAVSVSLDLWTTVSGYNQDIGIVVSGGAYGVGTLVGWKESGGLAGTFSPNAAFLTTDLHLPRGFTYTVKPAWKANALAQFANAIMIGAGPMNQAFSPTWLTAVQLP
jgi:hypothetical protein